MLKKNRTILFLICLFLFFLTAPLVILYSQGYRLDFNPPAGGIKFTRTGGLGIKTDPKQAEIYINNELVKKTDFLFGSALIENLLPKKYKIEIKKEGYLVWEKNLEIREKEVTEAKNIVLFPENINLTVLTSSQKNNVMVENFWTSPDEKKVILLEEDKSSSRPSLSEEGSELQEDKSSSRPSLSQKGSELEKDSSFSPSSLTEGSSELEEDSLSSPSSLLEESSELEKDKEGWTLKLYDLERNIKSHLISEADVYQKGANLLNLEFSEDSKEIYLDVEIAKASYQSASPSLATESQKKTFTLKLDKLPSQLTEKGIIPFPENIITSKKHNQDVYYLDNSGYVLKNELRINEIPFPIKPETEYALEAFSDFIFLIAKDQILYWFSPESKSFEIFFERINDLKMSPDDKKLVFFSDSEIWILFLKDQGIKKAGEKLFLVRLSEKIDDVFWLNSDYLIFSSKDSLKIAEIDERDKIQTWDIVILPNFNAEAKIYFNRNNKKLYILNEGDLFVSEKNLLR